MKSLKNLPLMLVMSLALFGLVFIAQAQEGVPGPTGVGDDLFPGAGNGGYDVQHYTLDITWKESDNTIDAVTTIDAVATLNLSTFNLDFVGFEISEITVDGQPADYSRSDRELTITPYTSLNSNENFSVVIKYQGEPTVMPNTALPIGVGVGVGWNRYEGGVVTIAQVDGAPGWFPVNDHPVDASSYTFRITVPKPYSVAANGVLEEVIPKGDSQTFVWEARDPMASYLATVDIAEFQVQKNTGDNGLPIVNYFPASYTPEQLQGFTHQADMIAFFSTLYGQYPFETAGAIVVDLPLGIALETQTRPVYGKLLSDEVTVSHELSHQWFGNSIRVADWQDIWLNEGFASYSEALWIEHSQGKDAFEAAVRNDYAIGVHHIIRIAGRDELFGLLDRLLSIVPPDAAHLTREQALILINDLLHEKADAAELDAALKSIPEDGLPPQQIGALVKQLSFEQVLVTGPQFLHFLTTLGIDPTMIGLTSAVTDNTPPGVVNRDNLFNSGVYRRGALTLHALRLLVGDEIFFSIVRTYYQRFAGHTATTADFIAVAEEVSNRQLDDFFTAWLYSVQAPDLPELGLYAVDIFSSAPPKKP